MKKNTLALLSAASLSVLLAACGGGGSSDNTGAVPAAWSGTWTAQHACKPTFDRKSGSGDTRYYENHITLTIDSTGNRIGVENTLYNDMQCTQKAGSVFHTNDASQLKTVTSDGYTIARSGLVTEVSVQADNTLDLKDPVSPEAAPFPIFGGLKPDGMLCIAPQEDDGTQGEGICYTRQ